MFAVAIAMLLPLDAAAQSPEGSDTDDLKEEIERQVGELDLSGWEEFFDSGFFTANGGIASVEELLLSCAEDSLLEADDLYSLFKLLLLSELKKSLGMVCALAAAAMITALPAILSDEGIKPVLGMALSLASVSLTAGAYAALLRRAYSAVASAAKLTQSSMPIMCTLLVSIGSSASAGIFRPLMVFLSGTVIAVIEKAAIPLCAAGGVILIADAVTRGGRLEGLCLLIKKAVKWLLGILSALYFGICVMQGMTMAAKDGVTIRTAKFAIGKLVPIAGNMVSGTVDSIMGCALLVKNGAGTVAVLLLTLTMLRPLIVLAAGSFIFRAACALSQPIADPGIARLYSGIADMSSILFACVAVTGCMLALTVLVFIASGGITAGLW